MKTFMAIFALLLVAAMLFGCTQNIPQQPPSQQPPQGQPSGQPRVTTPVEDIAAQQLESKLPSGYENLTNLNDMLVNATS
ncbi:MAG: hypothetical protein NTY73_03470 [Candidatus Micrarchaeota archaeon]|nr:hypothetical protein [Candidatus Micrarchaeota archaeon]